MCTGKKELLLDLPMVSDEMEVLYCVFDIIVLDGETVTHLPLYQRHQKLQHALRYKQESVPLEGGQTVITGRVVPILPNQAEPPMPGYAPSALWSMKGCSVQDIMVRAPALLGMREEILGVQGLAS